MNILGVMEYVTKQHGINGIICQRKTRAVIATIVDWRFGCVQDIDAQYFRSQHRAQVMSDKAIAAAYVKDV